MGSDKEAMDIWMFGKPRPDLSHEERMDAWKRHHPKPPVDSVAMAEYNRLKIAGLIDVVLPLARAKQAEAQAEGQG